MNKKKSNNFIMAKDYIDNNMLMPNKTFINFGKYLESKKNLLSRNNKILPEFTSSLYNSKSTKNNILNHNNENNESNLKLIKNKNLKIIKKQKNEIAKSKYCTKIKNEYFQK